MKTKILSIVTAVAFILGMAACHDPYEFSPTQHDDFFTSFNAYFPENPDDVFEAEFDNVNHIVTIVIPYTYPYGTESYLELQDITNMKVSCNLIHGFVMEPGLPAYLDLTKDFNVTITDNTGQKTPFIIRGEIRKSADCTISDFVLTELGLAAEINNETNTLLFVTAEDLTPQLATVEIPHGATIDPDPRVTPVDFSQLPEFTVTAQDGTTKVVYKTEQMEPVKLLAGLREGSARIAWAKKNSDIGLAVYSGADYAATSNMRFHGSAGLGIVGDKLVVNDACVGKAYVLDYKKGETIGTIDLTAMGTNNLGHYNNWRMTSDNYDNLIFASSMWNNGNVMSIWKMHGLDGQLEKIISYTNGSAIANQLSITGDVNGDAIITASQNGGGAKFYKWVIKNGVVQNQTPEIIGPSCYTGTSWGSLDAVYLTPDENSEFISIGYGGELNPKPEGAYALGSGELVSRTAVWHNNDASVKCYGTAMIGQNSVENAGAIYEFNNSRFFAHNVLNTLGYAVGGNSLRVYDLGSGDLSMPIAGIDELVKNKYGAQQGSGLYARGANGNDVHFFASPDGFYLYLFFEFCNGYVGAIRFDCIDM